MEKALRKIADIISDMSWGIVDDNDDVMSFLRGYLIALMENKEITTSERLMLISFMTGLLQTKKLLQNRR